MLNSSPLSEELKTYVAHKPALLLSSAGKYALIKGQDVIGVFDRKQDAFTEGYRRFQLNAFMVQRIQEELDTCVIGGSEMELTYDGPNNRFTLLRYGNQARQSGVE